MLEMFFLGVGWLLAVIYWVGCGVVAMNVLVNKKHESLAQLMGLAVLLPPFMVSLVLIARLSQAQ